MPTPPAERKRQERARLKEAGRTSVLHVYVRPETLAECRAAVERIQRKAEKRAVD